MKKTIIMVTASAAMLMLAGCKEEASSAPGASEVKLESIEQQVSYIVGYNTAMQTKADGFLMDADAVAKGVRDVNSEAEAMMTQEEMRAAMIAFQTQLQEQQQSKHDKLAQENQEKSTSFLAENGKREGVVTTESGLQYEELTAGAGASPQVSDRVSVNYTGSLIDGKVFDKGDAVEFVVGQLIPGWVEALPMMKVGAKWKLYVPADLAYGAGGAGDIGPNAALIFEMELLDIVQPEAADNASPEGAQ